MSNEAVLSFRLQALQAAEDKAKRVLVAVQRSGELAKDVKRQLSGTARQGLKELRELKDAEIERLRGIKDRAQAFARGLNGDEFDPQEISGPLHAINQVRRKAGAALNLVSGGLGGIHQLASLGGPIAAAVAALALPVIEQVAKVIEENNRAALERMQAQLDADLAKVAYEHDYERKLKEDPAFAEAEARSAYDLTTKEEAAAAAAGRRDSGDFLGGF